MTALQRLGLNEGQQLNDYSLEIVDKYGTLKMNKLNNSVEENLNPSSNTSPEKVLAETSQANSPETAQRGKEITATEIVIGGIIVSLILLLLVSLIKKRK
jgi:hypothetical protein